jgi:hypothetical protein
MKQNCCIFFVIVKVCVISLMKPFASEYPSRRTSKCRAPKSLEHQGKSTRDIAYQGMREDADINFRRPFKNHQVIWKRAPTSGWGNLVSMRGVTLKKMSGSPSSCK